MLDFEANRVSISPVSVNDSGTYTLDCKYRQSSELQQRWPGLLTIAMYNVILVQINQAFGCTSELERISYSTNEEWRALPIYICLPLGLPVCIFKAGPSEDRYTNGNFDVLGDVAIIFPS